jgi:hypothetical protein
VDAAGLGVAVTGGSLAAGAGAVTGVTVWAGTLVCCTGASSSVLAALAGLGGGNGGNFIHPSSVDGVGGGVLRAALGLSLWTLGAAAPGRGGNCTHSSLLVAIA